MPDESRPPDKQQPQELIPDFLYESRHEFAEKLAYKLWLIFYTIVLEVIDYQHVASLKIA
jgi:hypothetical protein